MEKQLKNESKVDIHHSKIGGLTVLLPFTLGGEVA